MWQKYSDYLSPRLELIPLFILALAFYLAASNYSALPDAFPSSFGSGGNVREWGSRNMVFLYPGLSLLIYLVVTGISIAMAVTENPKRLINMPPSWKERLTNRQTEELRASLVRYLFVLKVIILGLLAYLLYGSIEVALGKAEGIGSVPSSLLIVAIGIFVALMVWKMVRLVFGKDRDEDNTDGSI